MAVIEAGGQELTLTRARVEDLAELVALLHDDILGSGRETRDLGPYERALARVEADPAHYLAVVRDDRGALVGTMHLTLVPGLGRQGATRLLIEAVRVSSRLRGSGVGSAMFEWAHDHGRREGADLVQLSSDTRRPDAHRFYARLGYAASHVGFTRSL